MVGEALSSSPEESLFLESIEVLDGPRRTGINDTTTGLEAPYATGLQGAS